MKSAPANPVVHLELHTDDVARACAFYAELFGWRPETIRARSGSYLALAMGKSLDGGMVECGAPSPLWLPYVEVGDVSAFTERAVELGAGVMLEPREGATGWRSMLKTETGGEVALWQPK
jgi:predicted enzyme related to lactoylglutathione lyase